jgi:hypothetical protein
MMHSSKAVNAPRAIVMFFTVISGASTVATAVLPAIVQT